MQWAHNTIEHWTEAKKEEAFVEIKKLAAMIQNDAVLLTDLDFTNREFMTKLNEYRECINDGKHEKIQKRIEKLDSVKKEQIYIERVFK